MNWHELSATSHYQTAVAIENELAQGHIQDARDGIEELVEALGRADRRALRSQLLRLMAHILKWKNQPNLRSRSWVVTIASARLEIEEILEDEPGLKAELAELVKKLGAGAAHIAKKEMGQSPANAQLSWQEIFEDEYDL
ncbi:MAG: DUF29 domain-containing protein [Chloroflexi bacterium]|nr:DUF29 domain-containing protein [Chloroflexota bacterium]